MIEEVRLWQKKLSDGITCAQIFIEQFADVLPKNSNNIAFVGMGGSGIAGRMLKTFLDREGVTSTVIATSMVPAYLNSTTLALVISYSGNTWETLDVLHQLIEKGVPTVVITHGGRALELAKKHGLPYAIVPVSKTPRSALGNFLGFIMTLLELGGFLKNGKAMVEDFKKQAQQNLPKLTNSAYFDDFFAQVQDDEFFHIWGVSGDSEAFAYRAQTQFNENSKVHTVSSAFPELCHNLLVGFTQVKKVPCVLFFYTQFLPETLKKAISATEELMQEHGVNLYKPPILGDTLSDQLFNMVLWADCASYYLALKRGVDSAPVQLIDALKNKHQQKGILI